MTPLLALFDRLCDLAVDARERELADLALRDPGIAATLRAMLEADAREDAMLARDVAEQRTFEAAPLPARDRSGECFGPYTVLRELGSGGMGSVWLARRALGGSSQQVALKFMRTPFDTRLMRQFESERDALARLEHPGIARLIDAGVTPGGEPFLATEYIEGTPLLRYVCEHALDLPARLRLAEALCEAVDYAHRRLLVHRDIKPSNVLVDRDGRPRLLDFGIAKALDAAGGEVTRDNPLSPAYAAPEQALGEPVSTATDVFALGLLLHEMLTGALPGRRRSDSGANLVQNILTETIEPPSERSAAAGNEEDAVLRTRDWSRRLRGDLDQIVLTALRREPERRYPGALALADDLRRFREGHPVRARPDALGYRLGKFARRHRGAVAAATLAVLSLVIGLAISLWQADRARRSAALAAAETRRAEQHAVLAQETAERVQRVKGFVMDIFGTFDPIRGAGGSPTLEQAFTAAIARAQTTLEDDPKLRIDLLDDFGEIRANQGRFAEARVLFEEALRQAEEVYGHEHPVVAETLQNLAVIASYQGDTLSAAPLAQRMVAILRRHAHTHPQLLANALESMGSVLSEQGRHADALAHVEESLALRRAHGADARLLAPTLHNYGTLLVKVQRFADAEAPLRESLALNASGYRSDGAGQLLTLSSLGAVLDQQGKAAEATAAYERAVEIARATFAGAHSWTASALTDLGFDRVGKGDLATGIADLEAARAMYEQLQSPEIVSNLRYLGLAYRRARDDAKAMAAFDTALQVCAKQTDEVPICVLISANRAMLRAHLAARASPPSRADAQAALAEAQTALAKMPAIGWDGGAEAAQAMEAAAAALAALQRHDEALVLQREALAIYLAMYGPDHAETRRVRRTLDVLRRLPRQADT